MLRPWLMTLAPILISFSFRLDSDQSLIGSGVASVRRGATIVVLLLHENDAPLSLIDENKLCKDELGGAARVPVGVHCARLDEERITGFERDRLLSFILNSHLAVENVKNHLARVCAFEPALRVDTRRASQSRFFRELPALLFARAPPA